MRENKCDLPWPVWLVIRYAREDQERNTRKLTPQIRTGTVAPSSVWSARICPAVSYRPAVSADAVSTLSLTYITTTPAGFIRPSLRALSLLGGRVHPAQTKPRPLVCTPYSHKACSRRQSTYKPPVLTELVDILKCLCRRRSLAYLTETHLVEEVPAFVGDNLCEAVPALSFSSEGGMD